MKMGELYKEMGFINSGHTVQATRADLVGQYIGHTGPKTKEMITRFQFLFKLLPDHYRILTFSIILFIADRLEEFFSLVNNLLQYIEFEYMIIISSLYR